MNKEYPSHVAMILDGNRRWAKERGLPQLKGHQKGVDNICDLAPYILDKGVKVLSVYAFSIENFKRTQNEVDYLMDIFVKTFNKKFEKLHKENIKIVFSGRREPLREDVLKAMDKIVEKTKNNQKGILNICLNYGGRQEIIDGMKKLFNDLKEDKIKIEEIDDNYFYKYMYQDLPPIDLLIRTSGEQRLSNFMLYQMSYAEMYFSNLYFPDFNKEEFEKAIDIYNKRDRRFGGNTNN